MAADQPRSLSVIRNRGGVTLPKLKAAPRGRWETGDQITCHLRHRLPIRGAHERVTPIVPRLSAWPSAEATFRYGGRQNEVHGQLRVVRRN